MRRPRLREKGGGEVPIPAYQAMQDAGLGRRMLDVLMRGISTRQYAEVLPEMASTCGVSKSNVSREAAEAGEEALQELLERRFDDQHEVPKEPDLALPRINLTFRGIEHQRILTAKFGDL